MLQKELTDAADLPANKLHGQFLNLKKYNDLVNGNVELSIEIGEALARKLAISVDCVTDAIIDQKSIYGITTGFGGMSDTRIDCDDVAALQSNLLTFLASGAGEEVDSVHTRGAMLLRANVLLHGKSGIRSEVIQRLLKFVQCDAIPVVRELGSIGASGDLVPLSTIARAITGQSDRVAIDFRGERQTSSDVLRSLELEPIQLRAKEGLALVNGTSFSSAIAANTTIAANQSVALSFVIQANLMRALDVDCDPFQPFVHESKPHPGQVWSAKTIQSLLAENDSQRHRESEYLQDRYSLRCFPQYTGPIVEGVSRINKIVETEMNSVSDNPLIDPDNRQFFQSGNFLGQYIGVAMDELRRHLGLLAKHMDVQIASLVSPEFNKGLTASLRGNESKTYNMGLKGLQICGNSIVPMLTHAANPLVEHFPTHAEQFNQNINGLSWGAANLAWKSIQLYLQYLAVASLFAVQAIDLRAKASLGHFDGRVLLSDVGRNFYETVCELLNVEPTEERPYLFDDSDRWLEEDVQRLVGDISIQGKLVEAVDPVMTSFEDFCEKH